MHGKPFTTASSYLGPARTSTPRGMARWRLFFILLILGVMATFVVVGIRGYREEGRIALINSHVDKVSEKVSAYAKVYGRYPRDLNELVELGYIDGEETRDAWGAELEYRKDAGGIDGGFTICSFGPDGRGDSEDDVCGNSEYE